ncbi:MAG: PKD domain-containing protein [Stagnimonas sp.]|nr:PKD domain-containing protein [Stagnimonas sp.]
MQLRAPVLATGLLLFLPFAAPSQAADPASGTLSPTTPELSYSTGAYTVPAAATGCSDETPCDSYALTVELPADYALTHPGDRIHIVATMGNPAADYDMALLDADGNEVANSGNGPGAAEIADIAAGAGTSTYTVLLTPYVPVGAAANVTISLVVAPPPPPPPPPYTGPVPRYQIYTPPTPLGETSGEPSLGYNLATKRAMYISGLQTLRATFPENLDPVQPESCEANWEDVSYVLTSTASLDPILFTDQRTGRTFVSQLNSQSVPVAPVLVGANSLFAYTDDDGANWTPGQIDAPNGSYDHQTVGAGPYPATLAPALSNPVNKGSAVYYCSQVGVDGLCARSDTGGLTFNRPTTTFTLLECGAIHGHVRVAPDGTVYLPARSCGENQGVSVSTDAGTTWTVRKIPTSAPPPGILDPSIGLASDGSGYFCYINSDGHPHVAVTHDQGATWENDTDIGAGQSIRNAVFVEAIAGDPDRAACGFIGTTQAGNHEALDFPGLWYLFMAHTYDGGKTWVTVNATPDDPVQAAGGIWNQGGSSPNRNLLDFNEITVDERGYPLYSYADGCIGDCLPVGPNSYSEKANIARQRGGLSLYSAFDPVEPALPRQACLGGRRDDTGSFLRWRKPDDGGSAISGYQVYRSETADGPYSQVGMTGGKAAFNDRSVDPAVAKYYYKVTAINARGASGDSNLIELPLSPRPVADGACVIPGVLTVSAPTGDATIPNDAFDIQSVSVAEPQDLDGKLVFTLKVVSLAQVPPGFRWAVRFKPPATPPPDVGGAPQEDFYVAMVSADGAAPSFTYGTTGLPNENAPGRFFSTLGDLEPESAYSVDGSIVMVLDKSKIGAPVAGDALINVYGSVRASTPTAVPGTGGVNQTIPDSTGGGSYQLRAANFCLPNTAPLAALTAAATRVAVGQTLAFDGSGSSDADTGLDTIAKYAFNFGDGSEEVEQAGASAGHSYANPGLYAAKLVVTDSRGKLSSNVASVLVEVSAAGSSSGGSSSGSTSSGGSSSGSGSSSGGTEGGTGRFGGALGGLGLLPLLLAAARRRRLQPAD